LKVFNDRLHWQLRDEKNDVIVNWWPTTGRTEFCAPHAAKGPYPTINSADDMLAFLDAYRVRGNKEEQARVIVSPYDMQSLGEVHPKGNPHCLTCCGRGWYVGVMNDDAMAPDGTRAVFACEDCNVYSTNMDAARAACEAGLLVNNAYHPCFIADDPTNKILFSRYGCPNGTTTGWQFQFQAKLRVELIRYGILVIGRVLYMDDSLRRDEDTTEPKILLTVLDDNFSLCSDAHPQLTASKLFVRGANRKKDNQPFVARCESEVEATKLCERIARAVRLLNRPQPVRVTRSLDVQVLE